MAAPPPEETKEPTKKESKDKDKGKMPRAEPPRPMSPPPEQAHRSLATKVSGDTGDRYAGEVADHQPHGHGVMAYRGSSNRYDGEWLRGQRNGCGRLTQANGDVYEGLFEDDVKAGLGVLSTAEHGVYQGEWRDDVQEGLGVHTWKDGAEYRGRWRNGTYNGLGHYVHGGRDAGDVYDGEFRDGRKHGHGVLTQANGNNYAGGWEMGRKHGCGVFQVAGESGVEVQQWINGTKVESAKCATHGDVPETLTAALSDGEAAGRARDAAVAGVEQANEVAARAAAAAARSGGHADAAEAARVEAEGTVLRHGLRVSLLAAHGELLSVKPNGELQANRYRLTPYEMLTLEGEGSEFALKTTSDGKYVSWDRDGDLAARTRAVPGERERFTIEVGDGHKLALKAGDRYVAAAPDGTVFARDLEAHPGALWGLIVRTEEWDDPWETRRPVLDAEVLAAKRAAAELLTKERELRERERAMAAERDAVRAREAEIAAREQEAREREQKLQDRAREVAEVERATRARAEDAKMRDAAAALERETDAVAARRNAEAQRQAVTAAFGRYDVMQTGRLPQSSVAAILQDLGVADPRNAARQLLADGHPASTADVTLKEFCSLFERFFGGASSSSSSSAPPAAPASPARGEPRLAASEIEALRAAFDAQEDADSGWIDMTGVRLALSEVGVGVSAADMRQYLRGIGRLHGPFGSRVNFGDALRIYSGARQSAAAAAPAPAAAAAQQSNNAANLEERWLTSAFDVHNRRSGGLGLLPLDMLATVLNDAGDSAKVFYNGIRRHLAEHASTAEAFTLDQLLRAHQWAGAQPDVANSLEPIGDRFALEKLRRTFEVFELDAEGRLKLKARRNEPVPSGGEAEAQAEPETAAAAADDGRAEALDAREKALDEREKALDDREKALDGRGKQLEDLEKQLAREREQLKTRERRNAQHELELREKQRELEDMAALGAGGGDVDQAVAERLRRLQHELSEKDTELERLRRIIEQLRSSAASAADLPFDTPSALPDEQTAAMVRNLEDRVERLMREYAKVQEQNKKLTAENKELRDLLRACRQRCEELERQLEELRGGQRRPSSGGGRAGRRVGGGFVLEDSSRPKSGGRRRRR